MASARTSTGCRLFRSGAAPRACRPVQPRPVRCNLRQVSVASSSTESASSDAPPPGCSRYSVSIKKPLGIVLEQNKTGSIVVVEVRPESNAEKTGLIQVGDQLIATSGVTYAKEADYGGAAVKMGQQVVRLNVSGESFKTVSAAIGSHPGHMAVTLEFQRCEPQ